MTFVVFSYGFLCMRWIVVFDETETSFEGTRTGTDLTETILQICESSRVWKTADPKL